MVDGKSEIVYNLIAVSILGKRRATPCKDKK